MLADLEGGDENADFQWNLLA